MQTIFHKIVNREIPCYKVWENNNFLAFLTPFPNTPGVTVVIPKDYNGDYIFSLESDKYCEFMNAVKHVAKILEKAFSTPRVALVFEGTGVAYVHAKLYPLHGKLAGETNVWSKETEFHQEYQGFLTTTEGPKMDDSELTKIQKKILDSIA